MNRLPVPNWTREGETWRVEPENGVWTVTGGDGVCSVRRCWRPAVAIRHAATSRGDAYAACSGHLAEQRIWIEDGRVVSWCLRP